MSDTNTHCPCGLEASYESCCAPYHQGQVHAPTAELLMRARYCAYVLCDIDYLVKTIPLLQRKVFDRTSAKEWSKNSEWLGLEILSTKAGTESDKKGTVEFIARFKQGGVEHAHHEISKFEKASDRWFFVDAKIVADSSEPAQKEISRNAPCPCGSGKKYKKCCAA